ncbi:MAG: DUF4019 domain-containing protein [Candidatus Methylomirabilales bacterium]
MKTKRNALVAVGVFWSVVLCQAVVADQAAEKAAVEAASQWVALVDEGKYLQSWDNAAGYFKAAVKKDQWEASLSAARKPLGKVLSRNLKAKQYATRLPGAPDGHYVVIQYETSFERKASAIETITPMREKDGKWRVAGYYIR